VDNAATTGTTGLQWFKVAGDGLSNGKWAVDTMIANGGWHYFDMPTCVAPGDYLFVHSHTDSSPFTALKIKVITSICLPITLLTGKTGGAQFYMECAQIRVTGSGTNKGSNFVSFPGAYKANDVNPGACAPHLCGWTRRR
jgi:cellulase